MIDEPEIAPAVEAELSSWSKTKGDGVRVGFLIHADDVTKELFLMKPGLRYRVGFIQIGDDERSIPSPEGAPNTDPPIPGRAPPDSLPSGDHLAMSAAILCDDPTFRSYLEKRFVQAIGDNKVNSEEDAATLVRWHCNVKSRNELKLGTISGDIFERLKSDFVKWKLRGNDDRSSIVHDGNQVRGGGEWL